MIRISAYVTLILVVCTITLVSCHGHDHGHDHHDHHHHHHDHDHHHHDHDHDHDHHHHDHHHHHEEIACGGSSKYSAACNQPVLTDTEVVDSHEVVISAEEGLNPVTKTVDPVALEENSNDDASELSRDEMFARGHMKPFGEHRPPDGTVDEFSYMIAPEDFYQHFVSKHRPVLFRGMAKHWPAYKLWTDSYLREKYGDLEFKMETKDDDKKVVLPERKLRNFLDEYATGNLYLVDEVAPEMREEVGMPLCLRCEEISTKFFVSYFWMSSGGTNSSVHEDTDENLLCVIRGSKRAILISPIYSRDLYADDAEFLGFSPVPADKVDLNKYPRVMNVRYTVADMKEGDMLYLPQMWWHQINSGEGRQQAVAMWWKSKPWWKSSEKIPAVPRDPDQAKQDFGSPEFKFSFASILSYYERWIENTSHLIPRPKCRSQFKTMADYHFESDNYETEPNVGVMEDEDEHIDLHCEFNQENPDNPCKWCNEDEKEDECVRHMLDYCSKYDDRGCVVMLPQVMNRLSQSEFQQFVQSSDP